MADHIDETLEAWAKSYPDLDFSFWAITLRIRRIASHLQYNERMYEPFGVNRGGVEILFALRRSPNLKLSPTELCKNTLSTSATVTARLDKLQRERLIIRRHNTKDRRATVVHLTDKGRELADLILESVIERRSDHVVVLSSEEREQLTFLLRKMLEHFEPPHSGTAVSSSRLARSKTTTAAGSRRKAAAPEQ